ncbi:MAG: DUF1566 domain-containing protein [Spirochaeta sp.]|nr:DUF1566 domain-containing protein [Spirochaeta sp.]
MGRGMNSIKNVFSAAAAAGIVIFLVFAAGCSGDLLGYIKDMIAQGEYIGIELPKTGQTTSYLTGDDGDLRMGVAWPAVQRFTVGTGAETGCITDNLTGLMWERVPLGTLRNWTEALTYADGLPLGGHSDWRLPNRKELRSLVNYEEADNRTWLNGQGFADLQEGYYWSSTTYAAGISGAWLVSMSNGTVGVSTKTTNCYVLAVRSGQAGGTVSLPRTGQTIMEEPGDDGDLEKGVAWPSPRFEDTGDGTICDKLTGLMWERVPSGIANWEGALSYANNLVIGGNSDWRLPNVNELESLINASQADSAAWLVGQGFSGVQDSYYWSSTTYAPDTSLVWDVYLKVGSVGGSLKASNLYVLAVRGGQ